VVADSQSLVVAQPETNCIADNPSTAPSAAHEVFAVQELLGMILTNLPTGPLRHAMQVSKQFRDAINPKAAHPVTGMRVALGLRFSRKIEDMTPSEHADLAFRDEAATSATSIFHMLFLNVQRRVYWLLNSTLDPVDHPTIRTGRLSSNPNLAIAPFHLVRVARGDHAGRSNSFTSHRRNGDESSNVLTLKFTLNAKGYDNTAMTTKGISRAGKIYPDDGHASWSGIKILTMPFDVRAIVSVDFRDAMHALHHHVGFCQVPGCQVGDHGVQVRGNRDIARPRSIELTKLTIAITNQETSILFPAEQATLGNLITFLNGVEYHSNRNAIIIRHETETHGTSMDRDWYYLGNGMLGHICPSQK
jgi:hypothetical protein